MYESLQDEIIADLTTELQNEEDFSSELLTAKVKSAIREVATARNYPNTYSDAVKEADMNNYYTQIKALAMYDYSKIGAEGQDNYSADGEVIKYSNRAKLFDGVLPIAQI
jgi:hypothetical protein